jgi:Tfp pilus assembly major pilin PilA
MPTFRTNRPAGLAASIASMIGSSPNLSTADIMKVDAARAHSEHQYALTEKIRQELEAERQAQLARNDPGIANQYASTQAGMTVPQGAQMGGFIRGESLPPATPMDDEGNVMPEAPFQRPGITPEQDRAYRSAAASLMANRLATGKTNAEQLTKAGGNLLMDALRSQLSAPDQPLPARIGALEAISGKAVEPYKVTADGTTVLNEMTGAATDAPTQIAQLVKGKIGAQIGTETQRAGTERARQGELGTRSKYNVAHAGQAGATAGAQTALAGLRGAEEGDVRAGRPRGAKTATPVDPVLTEQRLVNVAQKQWDALDRKERRAIGDFPKYLEQIRSRVLKKTSETGVDLGSEYDDAMAAIASGRNAAQVRSRFKQRTGADLPDD